MLFEYMSNVFIAKSFTVSLRSFEQWSGFLRRAVKYEIVTDNVLVNCSLQNWRFVFGFDWREIDIKVLIFININ